MADSSIGKAPTAPLNEAHIHESNAAAIVAGLSVLTAIMLIVVVLRMYVRVFVIKLMGSDDWWILGALACALGGYATFVAQSFYGLGRHNDVMTRLYPAKLVQFQRVQFAQTIMSAMIGPCVLKISVALLLMRFVGKGWRTNSLWAIMGFMSAYTIASVGMIVFQCNPTAAFWDPKLKKTANCYPFEIFLKWGQTSTFLNIATDIFICTLPIPVIMRLQVNRKTKMSLIFFLSLAYCATGAGIAKAVYQVAFAKNTDKMFRQSLQVCGFIELELGIIAASGPSLKPLVKSLLASTISKSRGQQYPTYGQKSSMSRGGYIKHGDSKTGTGTQNGDGIPLGDYPKNVVTITRDTDNDGMGIYGKSSASLGGSSEENILPMHHQGRRQSKAGGIMVQTKVSIA